MMESNMLANGKRIKCMVKVLLLGQMVEFISDSTKTIKSMDKAVFNEMMGKSMKECGRMEDKMEKG